MFEALLILGRAVVDPPCREQDGEPGCDANAEEHVAVEHPAHVGESEPEHNNDSDYDPDFARKFIRMHALRITVDRSSRYPCTPAAGWLRAPLPLGRRA